MPAKRKRAPTLAGSPTTETQPCRAFPNKGSAALWVSCCQVVVGALHSFKPDNTYFILPQHYVLLYDTSL